MKSAAPSIEKATSGDIQELMDISRKTFIEAFGQQNSKEDMDLYLTEKLSYQQLLNELEQPGSHFYLMKFENRSIGYLKLNTGLSQSESIYPDGVEIERIYVLQEFLGKGIGHSLLDFSFRFAEARGASMIWLGVWEKNERAIAFYLKHRFIQFDAHEFVLGTDIQTDLLMHRTIP